MPTYQYICTACERPLEVQQSFSDDALTVCPACAGRLRKVFSAVGVVFKGSGFYRNDSRAAVSAASGSGSNGSPDSSESNGDKGGDKSRDKADKASAAAGTGGDKSGDDARTSGGTTGKQPSGTAA